MGLLGLHRINHRSFRGTEFCVANQSSILILYHFLFTQALLQYILKESIRTGLINPYRRFYPTRCNWAGCHVTGVPDSRWFCQRAAVVLIPMKSRPVPRALPLAAPGDCGRCRRPGLGISMIIPSSVCSNRFSRRSSRSTFLAWSKSDYSCYTI